MNLLKNKIIGYLIILGILATFGFYANNRSYTVNAATGTPTPTGQVTPTPTRLATPTPTGGVILNPTIPPGVTITFNVQKTGDLTEPAGGFGSMASFKFSSTQTGPTTCNGYFQIRYTVGGTATNGKDYMPPNPGYSGLPGSIWVKVGNPPAPPLPSDTFVDTASVRAMPDTLVEGTETIIVTITGVTVGQGSATMYIYDSNSATPTPTPPPPTNTPTVTPTGRPATPTPSLTATPTATPTPTPRAGGYVVSYVIQSDWGNGATVNVTITNNTAAAVNGWTLAWTFPGNQTISNIWNATYTQSGAAVSAKDAGFNANIPAGGGSVNFGFNLNYSGSNAKPTNFTLNGTPCTVQ